MLAARTEPTRPRFLIAWQRNSLALMIYEKNMTLEKSNISLTGQTSAFAANSQGLSKESAAKGWAFSMGTVAA